MFRNVTDFTLPFSPLMDCTVVFIFVLMPASVMALTMDAWALKRSRLWVTVTSSESFLRYIDSWHALSPPPQTRIFLFLKNGPSQVAQ